VFHSNGVEIKGMGQISDKPVKEMVPQRGGGFIEMTFPSDLERVREALASYSRTAVLHDPNICPYCFQFSDSDRKKMTHHVFSKHAREFNEEMASASAKEAEDAEPVAPPEPVVEVSKEIAE
jgi:hypothetical protein